MLDQEPPEVNDNGSLAETTRRGTETQKQVIFERCEAQLACARNKLLGATSSNGFLKWLFKNICFVDIFDASLIV